MDQIEEERERVIATITQELEGASIETRRVLTRLINKISQPIPRQAPAKTRKPDRSSIAKQIERFTEDALIATDDIVVMKLQKLANEVRESAAKYETKREQKGNEF
jgi:hypothetical protein